MSEAGIPSQLARDKLLFPQIAIVDLLSAGSGNRTRTPF